MAMKIAWFQGDAREPEWREGPPPPDYSQDALLALPPDHPAAPRLRVLLVPDDVDASGLTGDDWDDAPASANATAPYWDSYPPGSIMLTLHVGDRIKLSVLDPVAPVVE